MNRHFWQACDREAGFSFVELLVTIIIAGIAFAAMLPVFVQAAKSNSADTLRQQVTNVAQEKLEKVRQLDYGSIKADAAHPGTIPNLYNSAFADGQFGPTQTLSTGQGARDITLSYTVEDYPTGATGITSQYKVVHITATWDAPPSPVKPVTLSTIVYRQYSGPPITDFSTDPVMDDSGLLGDENLTDVLLSAHVDPSGGVAAVSVEFSIAQYGGATLDSETVDITMDTVADEASGRWYDAATTTFFWRWVLGSDAINGVYDFQATALASDGFAGNTPHIYPRIFRIVPPDAPASVSAVAGNDVVTVTWGTSNDPDVETYEVFRAANAVPADWTTLTPYTTTADPVANFIDNVVDNGTTYYYGVRAITTDGRVSTVTVSNPATPAATVDSTPPTSPTGVNASTTAGTSTVRLIWTASTDPGLPSSGVIMYEVERSPSATGTFASVTGSPWTNLTWLQFDDPTAGWSTTWYYRIIAVDGAGLRSSPSSVVSATTSAQPRHTLTVTNTINGNGKTRYVWIQDTSGHFFDQSGNDRGTGAPVGIGVASKGGTAAWSLPAGPYHVWAANSNAFALATMRLPDVDLSGGDAAKSITN
jgi:type II secretory pathway pseudopilin PulG